MRRLTSLFETCSLGSKKSICNMLIGSCFMRRMRNHSNITKKSVNVGTNEMETKFINFAKFRIESAFKEWSTILNSEQIITDPHSLNNIWNEYPTTSTMQHQSVRGILYPTNRNQIVQLVKIANLYEIPIYPINNTPTLNTTFNTSLNEQTFTFDNNRVNVGCVIVNLSRMRNITFNNKNESVTIEPGVTQQLLSQYLHVNNLSYMTPSLTPRASGNAFSQPEQDVEKSLIGNALERGFNRHVYHVGLITSIGAILPNGDSYQSSAISKLMGRGGAMCMDGLFAMGNFGIVTEMTIELVRKSECVEEFEFHVEDLKVGVEMIKEIFTKLGKCVGNVCLISSKNHDEVLSLQKCDEDQAIHWRISGTIYGNAAMVKALKKEITNILNPSTRNIFNSMDFPTLISFLENFKLTQNLPIVKTFQSIKLSNRKPRQTIYWNSSIDRTNASNPPQDIVWFTPPFLLPLHHKQVNEFVELTTRICFKYGIEPLMAFSSLYNRIMCDCSIPIALSQSNSKDLIQKAHQCYNELVQQFSKLGFVHHRQEPNQVNGKNKGNTHYVFLNSLKESVDPNNIMAPTSGNPNQL